MTESVRCVDCQNTIYKVPAAGVLYLHSLQLFHFHCLCEAVQMTVCSKQGSAASFVGEPAWDRDHCPSVWQPLSNTPEMPVCISYPQKYITFLCLKLTKSSLLFHCKEQKNSWLPTARISDTEQEQRILVNTVKVALATC